MGMAEQREPNLTPLAFASFDELVEELKSRCGAVVIGCSRMLADDPVFSVFAQGLNHEQIGLVTMLRCEIMRRWREQGYVEVDEDGRVTDAEDEA